MLKQTPTHVLGLLVAVAGCIIGGLIYAVTVTDRPALLLGAGLFVGLFGAILVVVIGIRAMARQSVATAGGTTVLVVDDDIRMAKACRDILQDAGYEVTVARDATEAVRVFRMKHSAIGLAVVDWKLPGTQGDELIDRLLEINPHTKLIFFSGHTVDEATRKRLQPKVHGFLKKPFNRYQLLGLVEAAMDGGENLD